ncbi:TIGR04255 family protein [Legionella sainthelensi]|uniref:TIGR04255 family protein n=1 Tax=Legionella sainthelensi TaxID=28087 RepID=UPI000E1FBA95|nr:TIGR04255 family protein [Legionella sainthelensi]
MKNRYKKNFIQEAIFEAKFGGYNFDNTSTGLIYNSVRENYPEKEDIKLPEFLETSGANLEFIPRSRFKKSDLSELIQIAPGQVATNNLKYSNWDNFSLGIHNALKSYISIAEPKLCKRIGTRFINRFVIHDKEVNISDYFNLSVTAPIEMIKNINSFDLTLLSNFKLGESNFRVITKLCTDSARHNEEGYFIILDIDCYCEETIIPSINKMVSVANTCHEQLEKIFEAIITDNIRSMMGLI